MSILHIVGILAAIIAIVGISVYSGTKTKEKKKSNGAGIVAGVIMGTLVGGSSTVGTAQLAYQFGMSAWWFTLGGGIACLVLTLFFLKPFRSSGSRTLIGVLTNEYGERVGMSASVLNSIGTFINIISQLLSASAVLLVILPSAGTVWTVLAAAGFMIIYVVFGGTRGAGMAGIVKLILLYIAMIVCGIMALRLSGGTAGFVQTVRQLSVENGVNYFSLFARGAGSDLGSCISLILGVLTTQTYAQAIMSGKSDAAARKGGLLSAFLIPPIGIAGILVGLYMRSTTDPAVFPAKTALTQFVLDKLPPLPGGIVLGALFIAAIGTGAGLALGVATLISNDIIKKKTNRFDDPRKSGMLTKLLIVCLLLLGAALSTGSIGDTILNFAFMSMGLRGAVVFIPMCFAIWFKGRVRPMYALLSVIISPVVVLLFGTLLKGILPFDALFVGIAISAVIMTAGLRKKQG